ncbi:MAG: substrate-binding periplasmic protein [Rhodoferax sp.]
MHRLLLALWGTLLGSSAALAQELHFVAQDYPPFNWEESGTVRGGMADILRGACQRLRQPCRISVVPLARAIRMLEDGTTPGVLSLIPNPTRMAFSSPSPILVYSDLVYAGLPQTPALSGLPDLQGWSVGVVRASTSGGVAAQHQKQVPGMVLVEEVNNETLVRKLQGGRYGAQGAIFGGWDVLAHVAARAGVALHPLYKADTHGFCIMWSHKGMDASLRARFDQTLQDMLRSGEVKALLQPYGLRATR